MQKLLCTPKISLLLTFFLLFSFSLQAKPITIHIWNFWNTRWLQPAFSQFEKQTNTKIIAERLTWSGGFQKIITALAANQAPDIIELGSTWIAPLSANGGLQTLTIPNINKNFYMWKLGQYQHKIYAAPWLLSSLALFYNKQLLEQASIKHPPTTWQELLVDSNRINALSKNIYGYAIQNGQYTLWQRFLPYLYSNQGQIFSLSPLQSHIKEAPFKETLLFYKQLYSVSLYASNLAIRRAFQVNHVGFMIEEPGQIVVLQQDTPNLHFGVASIPVQRPTMSSHSLLGGQMLSITKNAKHPKEALALIQFLTKPKQTKLITQHISSLFSANKLAIQQQLQQEKNKKIHLFLQQLAFAKSPKPHPQWSKIEHITHTVIEKSLYHNDINTNVALADKQLTSILKSNAPIRHVSSKKQTISPVWLWFAFLLVVLSILVIVLFVLYMYKTKILSPTHKKSLKQKYQYHGNTMLFLLPLLLLFLTFHLFPILYSFYLSFTHFNAVGNTMPLWVGLDNYTQLLKDSSFLYSVLHAAYFTIGTVPLTMVLAIFTAVLLQQIKRFSYFFQAIYFLPVMTSVIVIAVVFSEIYAEQGVANKLLEFIHISPIRWLQNQYTALPSIMLMNIWSSFGFYTLIILASLRNIPSSFYEASILEGASKIRQFFTITLPLLKPTLIVVSLLNGLLAFQVFGEILIMTQGGPLEATQTVVYYIYKLAFFQQHMGYAAAAAYFVFVVLLCVSLLQAILKRKSKQPSS